MCIFFTVWKQLSEFLGLFKVLKLPLFFILQIKQSRAQKHNRLRLQVEKILSLETVSRDSWFIKKNNIEVQAAKPELHVPVFPVAVNLIQGY